MVLSAHPMRIRPEGPRLCEFWWMTVVGCFPG